jgi:hypothetical protein
MAHFESDYDARMNSSTAHLENKLANGANGGSGGNKKAGRGCCKRVSKFLFSHIGLVAMVVIYAVAGAFLFELLEQHEEAKSCQEGKGAESTNIVNLKSLLLTYIQFNITSNPSDTSKDNETVANNNIELWLQIYRDQVLSVKETYRYSGQDCNSPKWNFAGALLFAITVITTIGLRFFFVFFFYFFLYFILFYFFLYFYFYHFNSNLQLNKLNSTQFNVCVSIDFSFKDTVT